MNAQKLVLHSSWQNSHLFEKWLNELKFWALWVNCNIQPISPFFPPVGATTIYYGSSLTLKIINCVYFAMQSPYFHNFRRRHETYNFRALKIIKICTWTIQLKITGNGFGGIKVTLHGLRLDRDCYKLQ